jgi:hypothetical protein
MSNALMGVLAGFNHINQGIEQGRERKQRNTLAQLTGDYYAAPSQNGLAAIARAGGDPSRPAQYGQEREQHERALASQHAMLLAKMDPAMRAQAWPSVRQRLMAGGIDPQFLPEQYDEKIDGMVMSLAGGEAAKPMNVSPGGVIVDPATGREIYANKNFAPKAPRYVNVPDGQGGTLLMQATDDGLASPQFAGDVGALYDMESAIPGTVMSSNLRSPDHNAKVGGKPNSRHLTGEGADYVVPPQHKARFIEMARKGGYVAIDEGDHVHVQIPRGRLGHNPGKASSPKPAPSGYEWNEDGTLRAITGGPADPRNSTGNKLKDPTEDMNKAAAWFAQASNAYQNMQAALAKDPSADDPGLIETYSPIDELANRSRSSTRQQFVQASESLGEALLRAATGAGVNMQEARQKVVELTPQRGDSEEVKRQKMAAIPVYLEALRNRAGRAMPTSDAPASPIDALLEKYK